MRKLLSKIEVVEMVAMSYPTLWAKMRRHEFPRSIQVGREGIDGAGSSVRWFEDEVLAWMDSCVRTKLKGDDDRAA